MTEPPQGPRADVLLAVIVHGIATNTIPMHTLEDLAALHAWLEIMAPTLTVPPPLEPVSSPVTLRKITHD